VVPYSVSDCHQEPDMKLQENVMKRSGDIKKRMRKTTISGLPILMKIETATQIYVKDLNIIF
jgi:hypothetical protein